MFKLLPHFLIICSIIILEVDRDIKHKILNIIFFHIVFHMQKDGSHFQVIFKGSNLARTDACEQRCVDAQPETENKDSSSLLSSPICSEAGISQRNSKHLCIGQGGLIKNRAFNVPGPPEVTQ